MGLLIGSVPLMVPTAGAVHESGGLELDGDIANDIDEGVADVSLEPDWSSLFTSQTVAIQSTGTIDSVFDADFVVGATGPDHSYYLPSTKDDQPINAAGGSSVWGCTSASNPTDKNEILNAYAVAQELTTATGSEVSEAGDIAIYTGGERYSNNGTAYFGAWFFQEKVGCAASATSNGKFSGKKTDGDLLVLVSFDQGGANVTIEAFAWHPCNEGPQPLTLGSPKCKNPALNAGYFTPTLSGGSGGTCGSGTTDTICAISNDEVLTGIPWTTQDKTSNNNHTLQVSEFFEAGVNISDIFQGNAPCFSSYLLETRSSDTLDATLKDFAGGEFDTCGAVSAHKYEDLNANGDQDTDEPDLSGWEFFIDADGNGLKGTTETTGTTDTSGTVTFNDVEPGELTICEVLQTGWVNSEPGAVPAGEEPCRTATVTRSGSTTFEFGNYQPGSIAGTKFNDVNDDGVWDETSSTVENGVEDITINLYEASEATPTTATVDDLTTSTVTDENGDYSFSDLTPGTYLVCEVIPAGYTQTTPTTGTVCPGAGEGFGIVVTLGSGDASMDNNFGNVALHKVIVLVCHEGTDELVGASVSLGGGTAMTSSTDTANMFGTDPPITNQELCQVTDGATFTGRPHGETTATVDILGTGTDSGH